MTDAYGLPLQPALSRCFSARRSIKYYPHSEVIAEILNMMFGSRGYEHQIASFKPIATAIVNQHPAAANYDVQLILSMRR